MIQPLRTIHRRVFSTLALVLPVILVVGLSARHKAAPTAISATRAPSSNSMQRLRSSSRLWRTHAIQTEVFTDPSEPGQRYVLLKPVQALNEPDLLLYWSAREPSGDSLPAEARLVGIFSPNRELTLPSDAAPGGYLTLYSLAHQSVVDTAAMEKLP